MSEIIVSREWTCPTCDGEYKRIARHWGTTCPYPGIGTDHRATLDGLALGRASADGDTETRLRIWTTSEQLALWTFRELGWIASSVRREPADEHSLGDRDRYVVSTITHPDCGRYQRWGPDAIDRLSWSSRLGRAWFAHAGSLAFRETGRPTVVFRTGDDDLRSAIHRFLNRSSFDNAIGAETVTLSQSVAERFVRALGTPVPGAAHKWARDRDVYDHILETLPFDDDSDSSLNTNRATRYRVLLRTVAEAMGTGRGLSKQQFDTAFISPSAAKIADWLGGGSWTDAKQVAGIYDRPQSRAPNKDHAIRNGPKTVYDERSCRHALRRVAGRIGTTTLGYDEYNRNRWPDEPGPRTITRKLAGRSWADAIASVGLSARSGSGTQYTPEDCMDALDLCADELGPRLTITACREFLAKIEGAPTPSTIAGTLGDGYWATAVERAGYQPGRKGGTTPKADGQDR